MRNLAHSIIGLLTGLLAWRSLLWAARRSTPSANKLLWILFTVGLLCRILFAFGTPDFYAPDEQSHFNYIKFLAEHRSFPIQVSKTDAASNDWEYYQPPLYYLTQAPVYWISKYISSSETFALRAIRLTSIFIWVMGIFFAMRCLQILRVKNNSLQIVAIGMMSLLPTYTFLSAMINNDNLVICLGNALLCLAVRRQFSVKSAMLTGFVLGLSILTKFSAFLYVPVIFFLALLQLHMRRERFQIICAYMLTLSLVTALMISGWLYRNNSIYGSLSAENVANVPYIWPSILAGVIGTFKIAMNTFWAVSGIFNNVHSFFPFFGIAISAVACFGWISAAIKCKVPPLSGEFERPTLLVFALAIAINAALVMRFGLLYAQGQGRFFFPMLLPISLFIGLGFHALKHRPSDVAASGMLMAYGTSFTVFSLLSFPRA